MRRLLALCALLASPVQAQQAWVTPAVIPALPPGEDEHLLRMVAHAQVALGYCPEIVETAGPWLLLQGAEDAMIDRLELDDHRRQALYAQVIAASDKPGFCAREVPRLASMIDMLVFWGGSPDLIRD